MAGSDSTATLTLGDVEDLREITKSELSFIQSVTLVIQRDQDLTLDPDQASGLYYSLQHIKDNITKAVENLSANRVIASNP